MRLRSLSLAFSIILASAGGAAAVPLTLSNLEGAWQDPVALPATMATLTISNNPTPGIDEIRWGTPDNPGDLQSGYDFEAVAGPVVPVLGVPFLLGTFTHLNNTITLGTSFFTAVDLAFGFDTNGVPSSIAAVFNFTHNETPNIAASCPADVIPCDDIVTVDNDPVNKHIIAGGADFFLNLLGFSTDGGTTFSSDYFSQEGGTNSAELYGLATATPIPEPATLALFGAGLALVAMRLRRRKTDAAA